MQLPETTHLFKKNKRKTLMGLRRSALGEMIIALAALLIFDALALDHTRYWSVNPHPFWFVVLLIACKYGTGEALVAALLSSIALLAGNLPEQTINQDGYAYLMLVLKLPLLWLVSAVVFGELRQLHIRERDHLEKALEESEERESRIAQSYQWVKSLKDQLELRMAGQLRSSIAAYHAAKSMESLSLAEVFKGLEKLIDATLYPEQFSIYSLSASGLDATLMHGWRETDSYLRHFGSGNALYESIIGRHEILCVANADQERLLTGQAILAGPLMDKESGEVVGMLKIEKMGFTDLHLSNIEAFATICEWAGMAIVNARKYQSAKSSSIINPDHNLLTQTYFGRYTDYIASLAKRVGFDVSMVVIKLTNPAQFDSPTRSRIARALSEAINDVMRAVDLAFDQQANEDEYAIVLPVTGKEGAQIVINKIRGAIATRVAAVARDANFTFTIQMIYEKRAT